MAKKMWVKLKDNIKVYNDGTFVEWWNSVLYQKNYVVIRLKVEIGKRWKR